MFLQVPACAVGLTHKGFWNIIGRPILNQTYSAVIPCILKCSHLPLQRISHPRLGQNTPIPAECFSILPYYCGKCKNFFEKICKIIQTFSKNILIHHMLWVKPLYIYNPATCLAGKCRKLGSFFHFYPKPAPVCHLIFAYNIIRIPAYYIIHKKRAVKLPLIKSIIKLSGNAL